MNTDTHKHTPGPWHLGVRRPCSSLFVYSDDGAEVADCDFSTNAAENLANARLITAAPDLLDALEDAEKALTQLLCDRVLDSTTGPFFTVRKLRDDARAAIARATGNQTP